MKRTTAGGVAMSVIWLGALFPSTAAAVWSAPATVARSGDLPKIYSANDADCSGYAEANPAGGALIVYSIGGYDHESYVCTYVHSILRLRDGAIVSRDDQGLDARFDAAGNLLSVHDGHNLRVKTSRGAGPVETTSVPGSSDHSLFEDVKFDVAGTFTTVWWEHDLPDSGGGLDLERFRVAWRSSTTDRFHTAELAKVDEESFGTSPDCFDFDSGVRSNPRGDVAFAWASNRYSGRLKRMVSAIQIRTKSAKSSKFSSVKRLTPRTGLACVPQVTVGPGGDIAVSWLEWRRGAWSLHIKVRHKGHWSRARQLGPESRRRNSDESGLYVAAVSFDRLGRMAIGWVDKRGLNVATAGPSERFVSRNVVGAAATRELQRVYGFGFFGSLDGALALTWRLGPYGNRMMAIVRLPTGGFSQPVTLVNSGEPITVTSSDVDAGGFVHVGWIERGQLRAAMLSPSGQVDGPSVVSAGADLCPTCTISVSGGAPRSAAMLWRGPTVANRHDIFLATDSP